MQIRQLKISNFRGIASLDWSPAQSLCCLIGSGDSGKSTVLDAVEALLSSRWYTFTEPDFFGCDTTRPIVIEATIGELSPALKSDERLGLHVRGWTTTMHVRDEPEGDDEPVLTVRLTVDATMEPVWELVCERVDDARVLSNRDRALFGLVRLAGEDARHLAWGQGSVLARLTGDAKDAAASLADAYRAARASANLDQVGSLSDAATKAEGFARSLGAYVEGGYGPGLELGRSGLSSGSIALHDDGVPLRLAGLGTRRLATLAIQKSGVPEGAIVLVDEVEHGLEPHRIIGAIAQLRADQAASLAASTPIGQILMTTHSDVALAEIGVDGLRLVHATRPGRQVIVSRATNPAVLQTLVRFTPRALFARRILVTEGNTEIGLLLGYRIAWPPRHEFKPIEQLSAAIADGNGAQACAIATALAGMGYVVALYRDSDTALSGPDRAALAGAGIPVFEYGHGLNTEQALFSVAADDVVERLLALARLERGDDAVNDNLRIAIPSLSAARVREDFASWADDAGLSPTDLRQRIAEVAARKKWFKDQRIGRGLAPMAMDITRAAPTSAVALTLAAIENWLYA